MLFMLLLAGEKFPGEVSLLVLILPLAGLSLQPACWEFCHPTLGHRNTLFSVQIVLVSCILRCCSPVPVTDSDSPLWHVAARGDW